LPDRILSRSAGPKKTTAAAAIRRGLTRNVALFLWRSAQGREDPRLWARTGAELGVEDGIKLE
jgi:hypothetical protein